MVGRGDLGVELNPKKCPAAEAIVESARRSGKPVIVATQMLESMIEAPPRPAPKCPTWPTRSMTAPTR
jgi:pyruvate kinase